MLFYSSHEKRYRPNIWKMTQDCPSEVFAAIHAVNTTDSSDVYKQIVYHERQSAVAQMREKGCGWF